jgi:hypothetical protein
MTRSEAIRMAKEALEEKHPDLSIGNKTHKINIDDSTNITGIYELYGVYNTRNWDSLFHFVLYLKITGDKIIKISHVEAGKNLLKILTQEMYVEDIKDKTLLDTGKFKCKKSDIYKRALSLWANSDNIYKASTQFPSSCSGFVLSILIFISDEFCIKLIKFIEEKGLNQDSLEVAIWIIGKTDGLSGISAEKSDIKTYEEKIKTLRTFNFKYEDYNKDSWTEIIYLYNLKKNNSKEDYIYKKDLYLKQKKQTLQKAQLKGATKVPTKVLTKRPTKSATKRPTKSATKSASKGTSKSATKSATKGKGTSKTGRVIAAIQPISKKIPITKSPINKAKKRSVKLVFNPKNKSKNKSKNKKKSKKLHKSKN